MNSPQDTEKCKELFALLSDYLDLESPPGACKHIEAHLAGCPPCIEFVESLRKTVELCRGYQPTELPEPMTRQAREELAEAYKKASGLFGTDS